MMERLKQRTISIPLSTDDEIRRAEAYAGLNKEAWIARVRGGQALLYVPAQGNFSQVQEWIRFGHHPFFSSR
jgi:hypothetical protein